MSEPSPLEALRSEYAQLHRQHPSTLTQDQKRSLTVYSAEQTCRDSGEIAGTVPRDIANWILSLSALEAFVRAEGRLPRENRRLPAGAISAEEKRSNNSIRAQRRSFAAGRLCSYQVRRLLCIPGFSFHPIEDRWRANYEAYDQFTAAHGHAPRLRSTDDAEQSLARWAAKTRMARRAGTLSPAKVATLNELNFWAWGAPYRRK
ncbi:helicase associated domain-containing protein [Cryobacterium sp. AP23]